MSLLLYICVAIFSCASLELRDPLHAWLQNKEHHRPLKSVFCNETNTPQLVYIHIPKTAGMSFYTILSQALNCSNCLKRLDLNFAPAAEHRAIYQKPWRLAEYMNHTRGVVGHLDTSIVNYIPNVVFISILRDPVERMLSWFHYLQSNSRDIIQCGKWMQMGVFTLSDLHVGKNGSVVARCNRSVVRAQLLKPSFNLSLYEANQKSNWDELGSVSSRFGPTALPPSVTLDEFLAKLCELQMDNYVTRAFAGATTHSMFANSRRLSDTQMLDIARDMLSAFGFIGLTEEFAQSMKRFLQLTEIPMKQLEIVRENITPSYGHKVSGATRQAILQIEWMDVLLYQAAKNRFYPS